MTQALAQLFALPAHLDAGNPIGLTSVCSAHPMVIEAALLEAKENRVIACIEATCNQVNQDGGYTGMTPADFRDFVLDIAERLDFPRDQILLGGDHLGPNPWRKGTAELAMRNAITMTRAYAAAGFGKIHLDASMACADDPAPLPDATIAQRAALLALAAEEGARAGGHPPPAYIVGTEVPVPGGAAEEIETLVVTAATDAAETLQIHKSAFAEQGLDAAFSRVVALVVQPGVEFGNANVIAFKPLEAKPLTKWRNNTGAVAFEAHSTDYQSAEGLKALVQAGFCILKVGPGLTFALREALYGLDQIAGAILPDYQAGSLPDAMEQAMLAAPENWDGYYHGSPAEQFVQRHYSYSDRIRYYWHSEAATAAVEKLFSRLENVQLPEPLISQFLSRHYHDVMAGRVPPEANALVVAAIRCALAPYTAACT